MITTEEKRRITSREVKTVLNSTMTVLGCNVRYYRKKMEMKQSELAYLIGTDASVINKIENVRQYNPELLTLAKIAHVLEININALFIPLENAT